MKIIKIKFKKVAWGRQRPRGRRLDSPALVNNKDKKNKKAIYKISSKNTIEIFYKVQQFQKVKVKKI